MSKSCWFRCVCVRAREKTKGTKMKLLPINDKAQWRAFDISTQKKKYPKHRLSGECLIFWSIQRKCKMTKDNRIWAYGSVFVFPNLFRLTAILLLSLSFSPAGWQTEHTPFFFSVDRFVYVRLPILGYIRFIHPFRLFICATFILDAILVSNIFFFFFFLLMLRLVFVRFGAGRFSPFFFYCY